MAEALACLKDLLRIDTSNPPGNERPAAELVAATLSREGIPAQILESAPGRASVIARLKGSGWPLVAGRVAGVDPKEILQAGQPLGRGGGPVDVPHAPQ